MTEKQPPVKKLKLTHIQLTNLYLAVILLELFLMGGGRILSVGSISARMVLFVVTMIITVYLVVKEGKIDRQVTFITIFFSLLLAFGLFNGVIFHHADPDIVFADLKPMAFFYMVVFFSLVIIRPSQVKMIAELVKTSGVLLAVGYIVLLILILLGKIDFQLIYDIFSQEQEVFFRGDQGFFFYKGFMYLCAGFLFLMFDKKLFKKGLGLFVLGAIVLTLTRSFLASTFFVVIIYFFLVMPKKFFVKVALGLVVLMAVGLFASWYLSSDVFESLVGEKTFADRIRFIQIDEAVQRITPLSALVGHGFGIGVPIRKIHMEISFLEIFHKQGILGVIWWITLLYLIWDNFRGAVRNGYSEIAVPFFLTSLFIYIQSQLNPFMNNPIGMSFLLLTLVSLNVLKQEKFRVSSDGEKVPEKGENIG